MLGGIAGVFTAPSQGACLRYLGAELFAACGSVMLSAEKQCCLVLLCLQGSCLGRRRGPCLCQGCHSILWMHGAASLHAVGMATQTCHTGRCTTQKCQVLEVCGLDRETNAALHQRWPRPRISLLAAVCCGREHGPR